MDDPGLVRGIDGPGQRGHELRPGTAGLGGARQSIIEIAAFEQLQGDERQAVHFTDVIDLQDVRMPEPGDRLGLDAEACQVIHPHLAPADDHLEGDESIQAQLPGLVNDAHAPLAELPHDLVAGNPGCETPRPVLPR